jgi:hypothetical protein
MSERSDSDDWLLQVDAFALVKIALGCSEDEAENYLVDYACGHSSFDWRYRSRVKIDKMPPSAQRLRAKRRALKSAARTSRLHCPDFEEIDRAISRTRFWREARKGEAQVRIAGNSAAYLGPLFLAPVRCEVRFRESVIRGHNPTLVDPRWLVAIHLSVIRVRATPLIAALRSDGGAVNTALEHLRPCGRLPASLDSPASPAVKLRGAMKQDVPAMLVDRPPSSGESQKGWTERVMPEHAKAARNFLSKNNGLWQQAMRARAKR